jgi:hypothetical protein
MAGQCIKILDDVYASDCTAEPMAQHRARHVRQACCGLTESVGGGLRTGRALPHHERKKKLPIPRRETAFFLDEALYFTAGLGGKN